MQSIPEMRIIEARSNHLESLTTIFPRSFFPVNDYLKRTLPDTPDMRRWWARVFKDEINDPNCHVLTAAKETGDETFGILCLRLTGPKDRGAGYFTMHEVSADHNIELWQPVVDSSTAWRERLMYGRTHYLIETFGVDHEHKGTGLGKRLLQRACDIADNEGHPIFVEANGNAIGFYTRLGFYVKAVEVMPGDAKYTENMMIREAQRC